MSRLMLIIHSFIFFSIVVVGLLSPFIAYVHPEIFSNPIVLVVVLVSMVATLSSWPLFGGCPFTVWENAYRKREGKPQYEGGCVDQYARVWFGVVLPASFSTRAIVALLVLPVLSALVTWTL